MRCWPSWKKTLSLGRVTPSPKVPFVRRRNRLRLGSKRTPDIDTRPFGDHPAMGFNRRKMKAEREVKAVAATRGAATDAQVLELRGKRSA